MRIDQLKAFREIVNCQSISAAADKLYTTQSTLSHALRSLEKELGTELIIRKSNGISVSKAGMDLLPVIDDILNKSDILLSYANQQSALDHQFFITVTPQAIHLFTSHIYRELKTRYPYTDIHVTECAGNDIVNTVLKSKSNLGLAVCRAQTAPYKQLLCERNDLAMEFLFDSQTGVAFHADSPLSSLSQITKETLKDYPMLMPDGIIHPTNNGTVKSADYHSYYKNMDTFSNFSPIFDIMIQNSDVASLTPLFWKDSYYLKHGLLTLRALTPKEENRLKVYVVYQKTDTTPILHTALELLRNLKHIYDPKPSHNN